jgi:hypothetical protein
VQAFPFGARIVARTRRHTRRRITKQGKLSEKNREVAWLFPELCWLENTRGSSWLWSWKSERESSGKSLSCLVYQAKRKI